MVSCNLPNIELVVQWKLPGSISFFVQRAGHVVLLVEPTAYYVNTEQTASSPEAQTKGKLWKKKSRKAKKKQDLEVKD
ncbi:P-loopcontaining nucleoside triphosphate hydrolase protein [Moniliophthora roreri MCA 2997]|uniref:P-loopcontaining nucleoside triphosphate hydrolase protein n=1 Tax=Moniliophthora roreri (strain MCA 2997) TaxID=1381753 RepID=V2W9M3_MONRO|nr:P-loopcontaining nucleoside triphosphate hydrolase protein [Moniliophthora roreri MCA 2997]